MRMLLIQFQRVNVSFLQIMEIFDDVIRQNQINFDILATLPIFIGVVASFVWVNGYSKRFGSRSNAWSQMGYKIREVEVILNKNCPRDNIVCIMSEEDEGYLICKILMLEKYLTQTDDSFTTRNMLLSDLNELDSNFTIQQKLRTIGRMYRTRDYNHIWQSNEYRFY
jgi:hypothetical protein